MNILQISTYDIQGGAARAAYRLYKGLRQIGQDSRMLARYKASTDDSVIRVVPADDANPANSPLQTIIQSHYLDTHRTDLSNTIFSLAYPGYDLAALPVVQAADVINLHWIARFQSPVTLQRLFALGKPVVWTLHDQWAFTGGCHYSAGCQKYCQDCAACPQLAADPHDLPAAILDDKLTLFRQANLTVVTPSRWLAGCAKASRLFQDRRVEAIPNALEADIFRPLPKAEAKARLGLAADTVTLLFGAIDTQESRKGFHLLMAAMQHCTANLRFQQLLAAGQLKILCFGYAGDDLQTTGLPVRSLGYLNSDEQIALAYAAADLFILPSLEDNLPNTMLEAMSCGTPVVGFRIGGLPDMVKDGVTGQLTSPGDAQQLAEAILSLIFTPEQLAEMGQNCRRLIETGYTLSIQARRYLDLYRELGAASPQPRVATPAPTNEAESDSPPVESLAEVEPVLGPNFQTIYEPVLLKALKEYTPIVQQKWQATEADRAARLEQINQLTHLLKEAEADRAARLEQIHELTRLLAESEAAHTEQIRELNHLLAESEADRAARLEQIHELTRLLAESETTHTEQIRELNHLLAENEADRAARLEQINQLAQWLEESEADRAARLEIIQRQEQILNQLPVKLLRRIRLI